MKSILAALILSVFASAGFVGHVQAAAPEKMIAQLFSEICLDNLPYYTGLDDGLRQMGYEVFSNGTYHEFYHPTADGVWGAVDIDGENSGCSILHEELSEVAAQQLALQIIKDYSPHEPMMWKYEGVPSGWVVPFQDKMLYVIYSDGGLSADIRDK